MLGVCVGNNKFCSFTELPSLAPGSASAGLDSWESPFRFMAETWLEAQALAAGLHAPHVVDVSAGCMGLNGKRHILNECQLIN
jgi:hypothetical protein